MNEPFVVRAPDLSEPGLAEAAFCLQQAAHRVELDWLGHPPDLPLLWDGPVAVAACPYRILAAFEGKALRGLLVYGAEGDEVHIQRTVVDPEHFGEGWGYRLVNALLAAHPRVTVDTAGANRAAMRLYAKAGFVTEQRWQTPGGLALWRLVYARPADEAALPALSLDTAGWVAEARRCPSPNRDARADGVAAELLVVHNISLPPYHYGGRGVEQLFTNTLDAAEHPYYATIHHLRVSAHFFIRRNGELVQFVPVTERAWHAGVSSWRGRERCNDFSLGVELEGCDFEPFADAQYRTLIALARLLKQQLGLTGMTGHEHIAPGRKTDPGPYFDWARLRRLVDLPAE